MRQACIDAGVIFTIWLTRPFSPADTRIAVEQSGAAGILLEGEIQATNPDYENRSETPNPQAVDWPAVVSELSGLNVYKGTVTNFAPFQKWVWDGQTLIAVPDPDRAKPLIDDGWSCHTECYDMPGVPAAVRPESRAFYASHLGWSVTQPALGLYAGDSLTDYPTRNQYRNWSAWAAEYVL